MKKIILTGIALLILAIVAIDIYHNNYKNSNERDNLQTAAIAGSSENTPVATPDVTTTINNDAQDAPDGLATTPATTGTRGYRSYRGHRRHNTIVPVDQSLSLADNTSETDGMVAVMDDENETASEPPTIAAQTSNAYYGNLPTAKTTEANEPVAKRVRNVHFGAEAGVMHTSLYNINTPYEQQDGFFIGGIADIGLGNHFALQPGIRYSLKGIETENTYTNYFAPANTFTEVDSRDMISLHYLEVPLNLVVRFGGRENGRFMIGAGPYIAYLAKAHDKFSQTTTVTGGNANVASKSTQITPGGEDPGHAEVNAGEFNAPVGTANNNNGNTDAYTHGFSGFRTMDYGVNGFVGAQMPGGFYAKAGTEVGLRNIEQAPDGSYKGKNLNIFVSLGYLIGYKK